MRLRMMALAAVCGLVCACSDDDSAGNENNNNGYQPAVCGDGTLDTGEECDNGTENSDTQPDACRTDCRLPWCGDLVIDDGEECDDGLRNGITPSFCRAECVLNVCGDGYVGGSEVCDDGNTVSGDGCRGDCQQDETLCGNGLQDDEEECDNGALNSDTLADACRTDCALPRCGDEVIDTGELCDHGTANSDAPDASCRLDCRSFCGDGDRQTAFGEQCDDGSQNGISPSPCGANCTATTCGDGYVGVPEECDDAGANSDDTPDACREDCSLPWCGDGTVDPGRSEECDDATANSDTAPDACRSNCTLPRCGDGTIDPGLGEVCDNQNLAGVTCEGLGFGGGDLSCGQSCALITEACLGWTQLATQYAATCGLRADGTVRCWGESYGVTPVEVVGATDMVAITAGQIHMCGLRSDGTVLCWGDNAFSQLGDDAIGDATSIANEVPGLTGVVTVEAGQLFTCALRDDGTVLCWGDNETRQLGRPPSDPSPVPQAVQGVSGITLLSAGMNHACAANDQGVWCWGNNGYGQLGIGAAGGTSGPVQVSDPGEVIGLFSDSRAGHTCAVLADGSLRCWGYSHCGQAGGTNPVTLPTAIETSTDIRAVTMGLNHTCVLKTDDTAWCWGCNDYGQLGAGHYLNLGLPHLVYGHGDFESFSASDRHSCALKRDRTAWCWGYNSQGQLGASVPVDGEIPVRTLGLAGATQVSAGEGHSCALMSGSGAVHCWGRNASGQLGDGTLFWSAQPSQVLGLTGATNVAAGSRHSCAVTNTDEVLCWGDNATYQLGDGTQTTRLLPTKALGSLPADALQVSAGESHSCAVTNAGEAYCWGWNLHGEVGRGSAGSQIWPIQVSGLPGLAQQISAGHFFTCALVDDGGSRDVYCWGLGNLGQLGNGSTSTLWAPGAAVSLSGDAETISAGYYFACASLTNGQVECWGYNGYTQLGNLNNVDSSVPVQVLIEPGVPLTGIKKVTTGLRHACAMTLAPSGQVRCWGDYRDGQLGLAPGDDAYDPMHGITGATDIFAGFHHTCMLVANGVVWCTGSNAWGQLGDGAFASTHSPVLVLE